jgi:hypothetical protein
MGNSRPVFGQGSAASSLPTADEASFPANNHINQPSLLIFGLVLLDLGHDSRALSRRLHVFPMQAEPEHDLTGNTNHANESREGQPRGHRLVVV